MSIYDTLNKRQKEAVCHTEGPLLILAGAGSGKTRVLTHRIAYLIEEKGVNPWNILAITFTNKAAEEMRNRVDNLVGFGAESVWVSTFHSACVRILRRYIDLLGYQNQFTIYDTEDQKTLMRDICKLLQVDTKMYKERSLLSIISSAKNEMITPAEFENNAGDFRERKIAKVYEAYEKQLKNNNALDFDDLLVKAVLLLQTQPEVLAHYQDRFRYIMVDEYQDTNTVQFQLIRLLAGKHKNLCVVGDDDQSIYKFRGANIKNILNFEKEFSNTKTIKLEQNYRSTGRILQVANEVIRHNRGRKDKTLWTENPQGEKISYRQFDSGYQEAEYVAESIGEYIAQGNSYHDFAVLYRTNAQSRLFEERFVAMGIPYKIVGGVNFYARREIKDLLAYLKTIDNGQDDLSVRRIINVPRRGIGLTTINRIQESAMEREIGFYEALGGLDLIPNIGRSGAKVNSFVAQIEHFKEVATTMSISDLMIYILEKIGYIDHLMQEDKVEAETRVENMNEFLSKIASYEEACIDDDVNATLSGFLEEVALVADIDSLEEGQDYVVLMTLHSAKGLEFPHVFLAGLEEGLFPSYMAISEGDPDAVEEERRLCYVGITRAMERLTITSAKSRMIRGEINYQRVSRFVKEIPTKFLESGTSTKKGKTYSIASEITSEDESFSFTNTPKSKEKPYSFTNTHGEMNKVKQFTVNKSDSLAYTIGDRVSHKKMGEGLVLDITEGGRDYEVTIQFDSVGIKKMFSSFAQLVKVEE